jgi:predicted amidohydrolase
METTREHPVFLCHNKMDKALAVRLSEALEEAGVPVFCSSMSGAIRKGRKWARAVSDALEASAGFLVLLTEHGVTRWMHNECSYAMDRSAKEETYGILPVRTSGSDIQALPALIRSHEALELDDTRLKEVVREVRTVFPPESRGLGDQMLLNARRRTPGLLRDVRRNPFAKLTEKISVVRKLDLGPLAENGKAEVRVALASLPRLPRERVEEFSKLPRRLRSRKNIDRKACTRSIVCHDQEVRSTLTTWFCEAVRVAVDDLRADVVCLNELAMPAHWRPVAEASRCAQEASERGEGHLVIGGTYHDRRTFYNSACLYFPGRDPSRAWYHKQVSAQALWPDPELISVPSRRGALLMRAFGLNILLLVCLDLADFTAVASVVRLSAKADLLLVPTYAGPSEQLRDVSRVVSQGMPGVVGLANYEHREFPAGSAIWCEFGEDRSRRHVERRKLKSGGCVRLFAIDTERHRERKAVLEGDLDFRLDWLFNVRATEPV